MTNTMIVTVKNVFWKFWDLFCMFNIGMSIVSLGIWMMMGPAFLYTSYATYSEVPLYCTVITVFIGILFSFHIHFKPQK